MKIFGFPVPFTKQTDQNTVTPIRPTYSFASPFGLVVEAFTGMWQRHLALDNERSILAFSAVYACLSLISKDIGKLRPRLMQRNASTGVWTEILSPASPVIVKPNRYQTRNQFWEFWILSKFICGNTYALKQRDEAGRVEALYILDPRRVMPLVAPDGAVFYQLHSDNLAGLEEGRPAVPASEIIHDRHTCLWHPLVGVGPIFAAGWAATQGNRIQQNSAAFFDNMSRPSGHLTAPGEIDDVTAKRLQTEFQENYSGKNLGKMLVSGDGLKFEPFTIPAQQAQMIEQQKWSVEDAARPFHVPLYKIGAGTPPALANISALNQEYYQQALQPHLEAAETLMDEGLGLGAGLGFEFDLEGLLRMDPKTRAETDEIRVRSATLAPNESRQRENLPPKEGGDELYMQEQNFSLPALAKRDASEDPFGNKESLAAPAPAAANDDSSTEEAVKQLITKFRSARR